MEADCGHEWIFNLWIYLINPVNVLLFHLAASPSKSIMIGSITAFPKVVSLLQLHQREEFELVFQDSSFPSGIHLKGEKHIPFYKFNYFGTRIPMKFMKLPFFP